MLENLEDLVHYNIWPLSPPPHQSLTLHTLHTLVCHCSTLLHCILCSFLSFTTAGDIDDNTLDVNHYTYNELEHAQLKQYMEYQGVITMHGRTKKHDLYHL